jgi:hypothetical protein
MIVTKTVQHNGIEIRRSNEMHYLKATHNPHPMEWVVDYVGGKWGFKTLKKAQEWIDSEIQKQSETAYFDFSGNYSVIRVVDGKFTEIAITRDEYKAIKAGQ